MGEIEKKKMHKTAQHEIPFRLAMKVNDKSPSLRR